MLKLTEEERRDIHKSAMKKLPLDIDVWVDHTGQWWLNTENVDEKIYPKSKADLDRLFDLFVKPAEVL